MQAICPKCAGRVGGADLNVATDVAHCRACDEVFALSEMVHADNQGRTPDLTRPPSGTWYEPSFDGFTAGATTRSFIAWFFVPFMCVWSGGSLGGIYGPQILSGEFDPERSLFGIPFILGTLLFGSIAVMSVCGKVVVRIRRGGEGMVFTGVGPIGWRRRFDFNEIRAVREEWWQQQRSAGNQGKVITLDGPRHLRFGSMLRDFRREFLAHVLRQALANRGKPVQRYVLR